MALALATGMQVYKYLLKDRIGGGGFGEVWLAHDSTINRDVAIKLIESNVASITDKLKEAHIGNQLKHDNLVKVHYADVVVVGPAHAVIIAMDHHPEGSIMSRLTAGNFLALPQAIECTKAILQGLEYLHSLGLFHGDIKPKNVLCGSNGSSVLTDYGISCHSPSGDPVPFKDAYLLHIAPETILDSNINELTDIYQVGMTAFRLFNGVGAIEEKLVRLGKDAFLEEVKAGSVVHLSDYAPFVPSSVRRIINKAIHPDPKQRYQSAREMRRSLEALNYPGHWVVDGAGTPVGLTKGHTYRFEVVAHTLRSFSITCFKKNLASNRETQVRDFCKANLTKTQLAKAEHDFMQAVIKGEC